MGRSSADDSSARNPQLVLKFVSFSGDVFNLSRSSKIEVNHGYLIELKALSDTRVSSSSFRLEDDERRSWHGSHNGDARGAVATITH